MEVELEEKIYYEILQLLKLGEDYFNAGNFSEAESKYLEALKLIPEVKSTYEISSWVYTFLGEIYMVLKDYEQAEESLYSALNCVGPANPYIYFKLGQLNYMKGSYEKSEDFFKKVYELSGKEIFEMEDEKYLQILENNGITGIGGKKEGKLESLQEVGNKIRLKNILEKSNVKKNMSEAYKRKEYNKILEILIYKWNKIHEKDKKSTESNILLRTIIEILIEKKEFEGARALCEKYLQYASPEDGEREFLYGKVLYELGYEVRAKYFLMIAYRKSNGLNFIFDEDKEYLNFIGDDLLSET